MERVLAHLLILWVKSIKIVIVVTMVEEFYHARSHTTTSRVARWTLINWATRTILWYELLDVSLTLSWLFLTSSRDAREVIAEHRGLTKAISLVIPTCLWPRVVKAECLIWLLLTTRWPLPLLKLVTKHIGHWSSSNVFKWTCGTWLAGHLLEWQRLPRLWVMHIRQRECLILRWIVQPQISLRTYRLR